MPSPFPGMDPYLESPDWFPDLHDSLITFIKGALQHRLPEDYYAQSSQRVWLEYSQRYVEPDVEVVRSLAQPGRGGGGVALAHPRPSEPVVVSVETVEHGPFQESFLEIRRRKGKEVRLVTSLEVLSLANKAPGNPGREKYRSKQNEVLRSQSHLVEIDLLRGGTHSTAVSREAAEAKAGPFDYHVSVHRFDRPSDFLVYTIRLSECLPVIAIPLLPGDPDVSLDLQAVFEQAYDVGPYRKEVAYGVDPIIPSLTAEQTAWAAGRLGERP
ncbi:MAG: DUF4058 family protein [Isosphaeraceae bacterium]